VEKLLNAHI